MQSVKWIDEKINRNKQKRESELYLKKKKEKIKASKSKKKKKSQKLITVSHHCRPCCAINEINSICQDSFSSYVILKLLLI
jgi:hypothetical protein